jgi:hypothetical protein
VREVKKLLGAKDTYQGTYKHPFNSSLGLTSASISTGITHVRLSSTLDNLPNTSA